MLARRRCTMCLDKLSVFLFFLSFFCPKVHKSLFSNVTAAWLDTVNCCYYENGVSLCTTLALLRISLFFFFLRLPDIWFVIQITGQYIETPSPFALTRDTISHFSPPPPLSSHTTAQVSCQHGHPLQSTRHRPSRGRSNRGRLRLPTSLTVPPRKNSLKLWRKSTAMVPLLLRKNVLALQRYCWLAQ